MILQHLIIQSLFYYLSSVAHKSLRTKENFRRLAPKVIGVACWRFQIFIWSLIRGGRLRDVVVTADPTAMK